MEQCGLRRMRRFLRESAGGQSRPPLQGSGKAHPNPPGLQLKICVVVGVLGGGGGGRSGSGGSGGRWGRCRRTGRPSFHRQFSPRTGNRYSSGRSSFGTAWGSSLSLMFAPIIHAFRANCYGTFCEKAAGSPSTAAKTPLPPFPGLACRKRRRRASFPRAAAARR